MARFSRPFTGGGISHAGKIEYTLHGEGPDLSGWVTFDEGIGYVDVRVGVSFISIEQARR